MPLSNPYGAHSNSPTGPAKNTILAQRGGRLLKVLWLDRAFLEAYLVNNPHALIVYRRWFGDNNLDDIAGRVQAVLNSLRGFEDLVHVVETPWNEAWEGINNRIGEYRDATIEAAKRFKDARTDLLVCGGNWSVGTPYNDVTKGQFQDWEEWSPALEHLDFHGFHEYGPASVMDSVSITSTGKAVGPYVFRHQYVYDWLEKQGLPTPKIILSEFGIDAGGAGKGFRSLGLGVQAYMDQLAEAAPFLIANPHVLGALLYTVGSDDPAWNAFNLEGEDTFVNLLNHSFTPEPVKVSEWVAPQHVPSVVLGHYAPGTEFAEWVADPKNEHDPRDRQAFLRAFIEKREESAAVSAGSFGASDALAGGYPAFLLPTGPAPTDLPAATARRLGVPLFRILAVDAVESAGRPFGLPGRALIRFEAHRWLGQVPANRREAANRYFRVFNGVEQVDPTGQALLWQDLQSKNQAGRWQDLTLAASIARDCAFRNSSMGRFQILGDHAGVLDFPSAEEMLKAFNGSEAAQWRGFEAFIRSDRRLYTALVNGDAETFAWLYNGNVRVYSPLLIAHGWNGDH